MNLNDLPDEVLCIIFDYMDVYELKLASAVCSRWAELTFSGQRMKRVMLVYPNDEWKLLLKTRRSYCNMCLYPRADGQFRSLAQVLRTLKLPVRTLKVHYTEPFEKLRWILRAAPELQHFSIEGYIKTNCETNLPFPVLTKLKCLKLNGVGRQEFDFIRMNVLNLHSLYMNCGTNHDLEAWRHMSGQLKLVHMYRVNEPYISQFLELTFPHLEDFTIRKFSFGTTEEIDSSRSSNFFRRHSLLRRLFISVPIPVEWFRSITSHCHELTHLSLNLMNLEEGILESLVQLTKLRHLSFPKMEYIYLNQHTKLDTKLFRGAIKSLESVELRMYPTRIFLENLFEAAPQLKRLDIKPIFFNKLKLDIEFICENFSCLRRLELDMYNHTPADNSVRIDRLEHLEELKLYNAESISFEHRNNVRCLTLNAHKIMQKNYGQIAEKFPLLNRLTFDCYSLSESGIIQLRKLIPSCRIDYGSQRFYPQVLP